MIEKERTYLLKYIPDGLFNCPSKDMSDHYIPLSVIHPTLRIRKQGEAMMITKKVPLNETDKSIQEEQTIVLNQSEYESLIQAPHKIIQKTRYYYPRQWYTCEIDVFTGSLEGLVIVDIEFTDTASMKSNPMPEFCLAEITQDERIAGGMIAGKSYEEIEPHLAGYNYSKIIF